MLRWLLRNINRAQVSAAMDKIMLWIKYTQL